VLVWQHPPSPKIPIDIPYFPYSNKPEDPSPAKTRWTKKVEISQKFPNKFQPMPLLSEDPRVASLVVEHSIDVVISSSTLVTLADNHEPHFTEGWEIPVIVKYFEVEGKKQKAMILDKPLLKKKVTPRESNTYFYEKAFQSAGLQLPNVVPGISFSATEEKNLNSATEECEDNVTYNMWQFGYLKILIRCKVHGMLPDPKSTLVMRKFK
jgi:hypothetical protein